MTKVRRVTFILAIMSIATVKASLSSTISVNLDDETNFDYNEDARLTPRQLIEKYGYRGETHEVITEDGYILTLHRITGRKSSNSSSSAVGKQPVLVVHGLLSSSVDWIITGPKTAFGYLLADANYDVWLGNIRGNSFSRRHTDYTILDKKYWEFSWHEIAVRDIPAMIDYVLKETNRQDLVYVGHSQGTTDFWVMAAERPEYQAKVKAMFAFAPVAYLSHVRSPFYHIISKFSGNIETMINLFGYYEFKPTSKFVREIAALVCDEESMIQPFCTNIIFLVAGFGSDQLNETMLPAILGHVPAGASVKQVVHYAQLVNARKFQQYDHGIIGNLIKYKQIRPPAYDLSKIKIPVYLHYGSNDWLSDPKDVDRLYAELGNPVGKFRVPHDKFGHLDFLWGRDGKKLLIDKVIRQMEEYRN